ncbi:hypothetical protein BDZ94DRAFT_1237508 [Collybia nuda]|uniref:Uncharacterized protein n=1 Tax=Collybia nuda TaxID=64659 RepID=A0A9P6CI78_9AGAR|nr:hypothetical protein BDZ94DRAFT_1237508 [Collybia nuda]
MAVTNSAQANMVGTIIELLVMGAYTVIFIDHMKIMYRRRSTSIPYIYLLCTSIIIFLLCCMHAITDAWRIYTGFTTHMDTPNAPDAFFNQNNIWDSWIRTTTFNVITVVSDLFFVFRAWVVWNRSYLVCAIPFLLFLADVATAIYVLWALGNSSDNPAFAGLLVANASKYFFAITLALTLVCTILIAYKLWSVQRSVRPTLSSGYTGGYAYNRLSQIATIIFESAAIYSTLLIVLIITDARGIEGFFVLLTMIPPFIGIVFSSIIVRSMNSPTPDVLGNTTTSTARLRTRNWEADETAYGRTSEGMQIRLETITETDTSRDNEEIKTSKYSDHDIV